MFPAPVSDYRIECRVATLRGAIRLFHSSLLVCFEMMGSCAIYVGLLNWSKFQIFSVAASFEQRTDIALRFRAFFVTDIRFDALPCATCIKSSPILLFLKSELEPLGIGLLVPAVKEFNIFKIRVEE